MAIKSSSYNKLQSRGKGTIAEDTPAFPSGNVAASGRQIDPMQGDMEPVEQGNELMR